MAKKRKRFERRPAEQSRVIDEELKSFREEWERVSPSARPAPDGDDPEDHLDRLVDLYAYATTPDREKMLDLAVARLLQLAKKAQDDPSGLHAGIVDELGRLFRWLVLDGTVQQQIVCSLAVRIARLPAASRDTLREPLLHGLIDGLIKVLRVGATTTRDTAVEGLGGLLKTYDDAAKERFYPPEPALPKSETEPSAIEVEYFDRLARRRLMTLAVAGHAACRTEFFNRLKEPVAHAIARIRRTSETQSELAVGGDPPPPTTSFSRQLPTADRQLLKALYERADLLRTLPAVLEHASGDALTKPALDSLHDAATLTAMREDDDAQVGIAYARFQESVFRTIGVMILRHRIGADFDRVIADAVNAIRPTLAGPAELCNVQIRATIATVRTAMRLVEKHAESKTREALVPLFRALREDPSPWLNLGIAEGCYRGLPYLLSDDAHNGLTEPALGALFADLHRDQDLDDFARTHRQLIAIAGFSRILIRHMQVAAEEHRTHADTERGVRKMLLWPDAGHVIRVFQHRDPTPPPHAMQRGVAETLIAGMAVESEMLKRGAELFRRWAQYTLPQKVVLTRILAAELRASSQDSRALARYALLRRLYAQLPTVSLSEEERLDHIWDLVIAIPPEAAGAADADLQDFVDHCGRRGRREARPAHRAEDLPGHILAMVSDSPSSKIADAIAREIDLTRQHERHGRDDDFDFAAILYQVTLRGPDASVFDHLMPRVDDARDRELVLFFRRHVQAVQEYMRNNKGGVFDLDPLLTHVGGLLKELDKRTDPTLRTLKEALDIYHRLGSNDPAVWRTIDEGPVGGGLRELFRLLDKLAAQSDDQTHEVRAGQETSRRKPLLSTYFDSVAQLQSHVSHYMDLPVSEFDDRTTAMRGARETARQIEDALNEHEGLQPPERTMLVALVQRLRLLFERTRLWYCVEPDRRRKAGDEAMFWALFTREWKTTEREQGAWLEAAKLLSEGDAEQAHERQLDKSREARLLEQLRRSYGLEPPPYPDQRVRFERFYAEWMESELRVDALERRLRGRWSRPFRFGYGVITHQWRILVALFVPCLFAVMLHLLGWHESEGVGFFVLALITVAIPFALLPDWRSWFRRRSAASTPPDEVRHPYRLQAIIPRLARLIAVPMALTVELDHSYHFSLHASTWVLLLLMLMAYLTTRFFISREIVEVEALHQPEEKAAVRRRVNQVMAVALSHSFAIAMLFAIIFASTAVEGLDEPEHHEEETTAVQPTHSSWFFVLADKIYSHVDAVHPPHEFPTFLGVLPRDAKFDLAKLVPDDREIPPGLRPHLKFVFYPTLVLTWTALGLFVGVFLEGFVKGERLRGPAKEEEE